MGGGCLFIPNFSNTSDKINEILLKEAMAFMNGG